MNMQTPESQSSRPTLLVKAGNAHHFPLWREAFAQCASDIDVRNWDDPDVDPAQVDYVLVWQPEHGRLARLPNLKLILSAAAGVDHLLADPHLPRHVPVVRMVTTETAARMADFVLFSALALIRELPAMIEARASRQWGSSLTGRLSGETTVGVLGLGELGKSSALHLARAGFDVSGWSRSAKQIEGVRTYNGAAQFDEFIAQTHVLVNLLPQTQETQRLLDARTLAKLPRGAGLVNVGRSTHLDHDALLSALDTGHLSGAVLDVFDIEPLPQDSPFWTHPKVIVTPHIASTVSHEARARRAAQTIRAHRDGQPIEHLFDAVRGY
jgi:glyoxylate/hydroxypyruvate reductase